MIREVARREIESLDYYLQNHTDDYSEESHTAMMMAIKALEQEPNKENIHREREQAYYLGYEDSSRKYRTEQSEDAISRQAVIDITWEEPSYTDTLNVLTEVRDKVKDLPPVKPQPKTGHCVWCSSPYRIEYYWIDREGNTASYQDEDRHIVATGIAKYCPNCGAKLVEPQETETWNGIHAQITAPKGTFERIFNDADDENDI